MYPSSRARSPVRYQCAIASANYPDVGGGEVEAFGPGRRHDVGRVTREEQVPMLHRRRHEAAHPGDPLLDDRPVPERPAVVGRQPHAQLLPDALVGPVGDVRVRVDLEVQPRQLW